MGKPRLNFTTSWDDGYKSDVRVAELLKKYNLPGTFYIPTCCHLDEDQIIEISRDFEIGGHTVSHFQDLKKLDDSTLYCEVMDNKTFLEDIIGRKITKFCYPRGRYNERVINCIKACGYTQARTTIVLCTSGRDDYRVDTTIQVRQRQEYGKRNWLGLAKDWAAVASENGGYFHLWGHSYELDKFKEWERLEEFFKWLINHFEIISL